MRPTSIWMSSFTLPIRLWDLILSIRFFDSPQLSARRNQLRVLVNAAHTLQATLDGAYDVSDTWCFASQLSQHFTHTTSTCTSITWWTRIWRTTYSMTLSLWVQRLRKRARRPPPLPALAALCPDFEHYIRSFHLFIQSLGIYCTLYINAILHEHFLKHVSKVLTKDRNALNGK